MNNIVIYTARDFVKMRKAGLMAAQTLDFIAPYVKPGVSTGYLNDLCHEFIINAGAIPAPLNYNKYPKSICTSINHVVRHGIPDSKPLRDGDILNIDVTVILDGWYGDTSRMYCVGNINPKAQRLITVTYEAMMQAITIVAPGTQLSQIGYVIETYIKKYGYSSVRNYAGHGIGRVFHDDPIVPHYINNSNIVLKSGMFFTIEPMINIGKPDTILSKDGWTVKTRDKSLSAQFEHTIAVTDDGYEIFTLSPLGLHHPPYII